MKKFKSYFLLLFEGLRTLRKLVNGELLSLSSWFQLRLLCRQELFFYSKVTTELTKGSAFSMSWGIFWAVLLLISNIIPPATTAISGYLTDVLIANINQKLIEKSSEIKNLEVLKMPSFIMM